MRACYQGGMMEAQAKVGSGDRLLSKLLIFVTLAVVGAGGLWLLEVVPAQRFLQDAVRVEGRVTATTCDNRGAVDYAYELEGRTYSGTDQPAGVCEAMKVGDPLPVWRLPDAPERSDLSPGENLDDAISLAIGGPIFFSAVAVLLLAWDERRRRRAVPKA